MSLYTTCTCCGILTYDEDEEKPLCENCVDNQYATDRWAERDSIMDHNDQLEHLDYADDINMSSLDPFTD